MRKELGKWLLDISKYVATAVVISSIFDELGEGLSVVLGITCVLLTLSWGLYLISKKGK